MAQALPPELIRALQALEQLNGGARNPALADFTSDRPPVDPMTSAPGWNAAKRDSAMAPSTPRTPPDWMVKVDPTTPAGLVSPAAAGPAVMSEHMALPAMGTPRIRLQRMAHADAVDTTPPAAMINPFAKTPEAPSGLWSSPADASIGVPRGSDIANPVSQNMVPSTPPFGPGIAAGTPFAAPYNPHQVAAGTPFPPDTGLPLAPPAATLGDDAAKAKDDLDQMVLTAQQNDPSRGGRLVTGVKPTEVATPQPTDATPGPSDPAAENYSYTLPGQLGAGQTALRKMLGIGDEGSAKLGQALMQGGIALMSGEGDWGQALSAGLQGFSNTDMTIRADKRLKSKDALDRWDTEHRIKQQDDQLALERAKFEQDKADTAYARSNPLQTLKDERDKLTMTTQLEHLKNPTFWDTLASEGLNADDASRLRMISLLKERGATPEELDQALNYKPAIDPMAGLGM